MWGGVWLWCLGDVLSGARVGVGGGGGGSGCGVLSGARDVGLVCTPHNGCV